MCDAFWRGAPQSACCTLSPRHDLYKNHSVRLGGLLQRGSQKRFFSGGWKHALDNSGLLRGFQGSVGSMAQEFVSGLLEARSAMVYAHCIVVLHAQNQRNPKVMTTCLQARRYSMEPFTTSPLRCLS
jgi:hypothetical protein